MINIQQERYTRIRAAQDEEQWIAELKAFIQGNFEDLAEQKTKQLQKLSEMFIVDCRGVLFYLHYIFSRLQDLLYLYV